jgi:hypothetical protein
MTDAEMIATLSRLKWIARFMDNGWGIPFTRFRFGADAFTSFVPIGGDALMVCASLYLVIKAWEMGAPRALLVRMLGNVAMEAGIGAVPVIGGILDVLFMANVKNMDLLTEFLRQKGVVVA